jgi:putative oxidoreductase
VSNVVTRVQDLVRWFRGTRDALLTRDLALLVVRVGLAWIFVYHGASTLFGAFHGGGLHGEEVYFATQAHLHPATFFAVLDGSIQFFGGIAIGVGVFARIAGFAIAGDMIGAMVTVTFAQGLTGNAAVVGYQLNLALVVLALVVGLLGTGRFSLDNAVHVLHERRSPSSTLLGPAPLHVH